MFTSKLNTRCVCMCGNVYTLMFNRRNRDFELNFQSQQRKTFSKTCRRVASSNVAKMLWTVSAQSTLHKAAMVYLGKESRKTFMKLFRPPVLTRGLSLFCPYVNGNLRKLNRSTWLSMVYPNTFPTEFFTALFWFEFNCAGYPDIPILNVCSIDYANLSLWLPMVNR